MLSYMYISLSIYMNLNSCIFLNCAESERLACDKKSRPSLTGFSQMTSYKIDAKRDLKTKHFKTIHELNYIEER